MSIIERQKIRRNPEVSTKTFRGSRSPALSATDQQQGQMSRAMSDETPIPIPDQICGLNGLRRPLQDNLIAQREQTIRKIEVLIDKLNHFPGGLPTDLVDRITSAYEEAADELAAIDPENPPDASSVYLITVRLQALSLCVTSLFATSGRGHRRPFARRGSSADEAAPRDGSAVKSSAAPRHFRPMAEVMELFPGGLQERRLKQSVN